MKYDIAKLFTELDWKEIKERVEKFEFFEIEKTDKKNKFSIRICARQCTNGFWEDDYICSIGFSYHLGGSSSPYQRRDFLTLAYDKIADDFYRCMPVERQSEIRQLNIFAFL